MITAKLYGKEIQANTIKGIKCKATNIANDYWKPYDEMEATFESGRSVKYIRINKKCPNGTITYGQWK